MTLRCATEALESKPVIAAGIVARSLLMYMAICCMVSSNSISALFEISPLTVYDFFKYVMGYNVFGYVGTSVFGFVILTLVVMLEAKCRRRHLRSEELVCCCIFALFLQAGLFISSIGSFADATATRRGGVLFAIGFLGCACALRLVFFGLHIAYSVLRDHSVWVPRSVARHPGLFVWLLLCLCWLPFAVIRYPGGIEWDAYHQINQFLTGTLTNRWPVGSSVLMGSFVAFGQVVLGSYDAGLFLCVLFLMMATAAILAYSLVVLHTLGVPTLVLAIIFLGYVFCPIFPLEATSIVKDTPYADCVMLFTIFVAEELFGLRARRTVTHYVLFSLTAVAMCLMRNNGVYILYVVVAFLAVRRICKRRPYRALAWVCVAAIVADLTYLHVLLPALGISQAPQVEALSVPLQQTARYVNKYGTSDMTDSERESVGRVLDLTAVGEKYNPLLSDPVKIIFSSTWGGDSSDLYAYFQAWLTMGLRHPRAYLDAALATPLGFFYPDSVMNNEEQVFIYGPRQHMDGIELEFSAHHELDQTREQLNDYVYAMTRLPPTYLFMNTGVATWVAIGLGVYAVARKRNLFLLILPSLVGVLVCFASPTFWWNGARYALPVVFSNPFCVAAMLYARQDEGA